MKDVKNVAKGLKPVMLMVLVQISFAGINMLYKLVLNDGMSLRVVIAYRFIFATAFMAPLALILERKNRAKMTWRVLFQSFLCGLFGGALAQNLYLEALALSSATFASAMSNLTPAITFIMASCIGMEKVNLRKGAGKAKIIGTLTGIGGAMVLTLVKGVGIQFGSFHGNNNNNNASTGKHSNTNNNNTMMGAVCVMASNISYALWLIIQKKMSETYPSYYSSTALMSLWGALISTLIALCLETDSTQWRLSWNIRLLTVAYAGIVVSGAVVVMISWCVSMRGPLFVSSFSPLMLVLIAFASSTFFHEKLFLGSIVGAVLIVCGLYMVLWGKSKEMKNKMNQSVPSKCSHDNNELPDTVEVVVKPASCSSMDDKSNHHHEDNNTEQVNATKLVVRNNEDSSEINRDDEEEEENDGRHEEKRREEGEPNNEEGISSNTFDA